MERIMEKLRQTISYKIAGCMGYLLILGVAFSIIVLLNSGHGQKFLEILAFILLYIPPIISISALIIAGLIFLELKYRNNLPINNKNTLIDIGFYILVLLGSFFMLPTVLFSIPICFKIMT